MAMTDTPSHFTTRSDQPLVALEGISKRFGHVTANDGISLRIMPGRVHALLGENGAGKSTLMSILSGRMLPDSGLIRVQGDIRLFSAPRDALSCGIGMVYQHFTLVDSLTVAENVVLGQVRGYFLDRRGIRDKVAELSASFGLGLDPRARVGDLSMGEKQRVEICKLLYRQTDVLILDEPTAVLTPSETEKLFAAMRRMTDQGKAVVFISHKLQEVLDISETITILRRGKVVDSFAREHVPDKEELARRMLGRERSAFPRPEPLSFGRCVLEVNELAGDGLDRVSLSVRQGEILAVAGVAGNGQQELVRTVCGLRRPVPESALRILGRSWRSFAGRSPKSEGMAYIPEDRLGMAVCPSLDLSDNFLLTNRALFTRGLWLDRDGGRQTAEHIVTAFGVQPPRVDAAARSFSGGNLQKFVVGRELYRSPGLIVAENPTQGLDVAAMEDVWRRLLEARKMAGILLVTNDLTEALTLADRVAVMYRGRIMDTFSSRDADKVARIGLLMAGIA